MNVEDKSNKTQEAPLETEIDIEADEEGKIKDIDLAKGATKTKIKAGKKASIKGVKTGYGDGTDGESDSKLKWLSGVWIPIIGFVILIIAAVIGLLGTDPGQRLLGIDTESTNVHHPADVGASGVQDTSKVD